MSASGAGETSPKNSSAFTWMNGLAVATEISCWKWSLRLCFDHMHQEATYMVRAARVMKSTPNRKIGWS